MNTQIWYRIQLVLACLFIGLAAGTLFYASADKQLPPLPLLTVTLLLSLTATFSALAIARTLITPPLPTPTPQTRYDIKWMNIIPPESLTGYIRNYGWEEMTDWLDEVKRRYLSLNPSGWCFRAISTSTAREACDNFPDSWITYMSFDNGDVIYIKVSGNAQ